MKNVTFTMAQATFLKQLKSFYFMNNNVRKDCSAEKQETIGFQTFCISDKPVTSKPKHHHHHKQHKDHHTYGDAAKGSPVDAVTAQNAAPVSETTTLFAATDSNNSNGSNTLVVALSSATGGFVAAIVIVLVVMMRKKRSAAATTETEAKDEADEATNDNEVQNTDSALNVVSV